jgi:hypothetical protein
MNTSAAAAAAMTAARDPKYAATEKRRGAEGSVDVA